MKKRNIILTVLCFLLVSIFSSSTKNEDLGEVLKKADFYRGGQVPGVAWDLSVRNIERGDIKNELSLLVEASSVDNRQYALITFLEPKKFQGQKLLVRDNNMWFSKIELRSPVPISSRQRLSGPASNADVAAANYYNDYTIASSEETTLNNTPCRVLDLHAKNNLVAYPRIKYWISKNKNFGLQAEYYGKSDKMIKVAHFEYNNKVEYNSGKYDYVSKITISDMINTEDKTILNISGIRFQNFNNSKFQTNRLKD